MRSQFTADIAACTVAKHEAKGIDNGHQGKNNACSAADTGSQLAYKESISHIVYAGYKHTDSGGESKLQYKFVDGGFCHFVVLFLCTVFFHNCLPLYKSLNVPGIRFPVCFV